MHELQNRESIDPTSRSNAAATPLGVNLGVIRAVLLRDISLLVGRNGMGVLVLILMPLGHLLAITIIYTTLGRIVPVGTDQTIFFGVSILPFVLFVYPCRQIMWSLPFNKPLLYFSRVKVFDLFYSRCILELASSVVVVCVVITVLSIRSEGFSPRDPAGFVFAIVVTIYLAFSVGILNALIGNFFPMWFLIFNLCAPLIWMASGILFFPTAIPDPYGHWLALNPLLACVEWMRYSYYEDYPDGFIDVPYVFMFSTICLLISLAVEKFTRALIR